MNKEIGFLALVLILSIPAFAAERPLFTGRRLLPAYEPDAYGPLVFPEEVTAFLDHELGQLEMPTGRRSVQ